MRKFGKSVFIHSRVFFEGHTLLAYILTVIFYLLPHLSLLSFNLALFYHFLSSVLMHNILAIPTKLSAKATRPWPLHTRQQTPD